MSGAVKDGQGAGDGGAGDGEGDSSDGAEIEDWGRFQHLLIASIQFCCFWDTMRLTSIQRSSGDDQWSEQFFNLTRDWRVDALRTSTLLRSFNKKAEAEMLRFARTMISGIDAAYLSTIASGDAIGIADADEFANTQFVTALIAAIALYDTDQQLH